jgi:hypothetical protein
LIALPNEVATAVLYFIGMSEFVNGAYAGSIEISGEKEKNIYFVFNEWKDREIHYADIITCRDVALQRLYTFNRSPLILGNSLLNNLKIPLRNSD